MSAFHFHSLQVSLSQAARLAHLATQGDPDMRMAACRYTAWAKDLLLEALSVCAQEEGPDSPREYRVDASPALKALLRDAIRPETLTLAVVAPELDLTFQVKGWPIRWLAVPTLAEARVMLSEAAFDGLLVHQSFARLGHAPILRQIGDRVPTLTVVTSGTHRREGIALAKGRRQSFHPAEPKDADLFVDFLHAVGATNFLKALARSSQRWVLKATHTWDPERGRLRTELDLDRSEKIHRADAVYDAVPFSVVSDLRLKDVAGHEEVKATLRAAARELMNWRKGDPPPPKGFLLAGPPGCGKTRLAEALAGETGLPFLQVTGAALQDMWYGECERRIRDLFQKARDHAPTILFIDELDSLAMDRGAANRVNPQYQASVVGTLLTCLDGRRDRSGRILVLAATNHPDMIDSAVIRAQRFDRVLTLNHPTLSERQAYVERHLKGQEAAGRFSTWIARNARGASYADLAQILQEIPHGTITPEVMATTRQRIMARLLGEPWFRGSEATPESKRTAAYHEAGHVVVGAKLQGIVPDIASITVRKISQGVTVTSFSPFDLRDAVWAKQELARLLAGRAAESLLLNSPPSTGAESDMHRATELAMKAITEWGLDPEWGQLVLSALPPALQCSESHRVHDRINAWLTEAQALAESTLKTHRACVEAVAEALLDKSDLFQEDLAAILKSAAA